MALFKDKKFHVHSVTVHTKSTKMRKWLIYTVVMRLITFNWYQNKRRQSFVAQ